MSLNCRAISHMASHEDARLSALHSLNTLVSVAKPDTEEGCSAGCLKSLESNLRPLMNGSQQPEASTSGVFSCEEVSLAVAFQVSQVSSRMTVLPQPPDRIKLPLGAYNSEKCIKHCTIHHQR